MAQQKIAVIIIIYFYSRLHKLTWDIPAVCWASGPPMHTQQLAGDGDDLQCLLCLVQRLTKYIMQLYSCAHTNSSDLLPASLWIMRCDNSCYSCCSATLKLQMKKNWQICLRIWYHIQHYTLSQYLSSKRHWASELPPYPIYFAILGDGKIFFERADPVSQPLDQVFAAARNSQ